MAWPEDRPGTYDADKYWDVTNQVWTTTRAAGQGNDAEYVLAISDNSGDGVIYFRTV